MKFSTKLSLLISGMFLAGFCLTAYLGYSTTTSMLERRIREQLEEHASHSIDTIDRMLFERFGDINTLRADPVLRSKSSTREQLTERLTHYLNNYKTYSSLSVFSLDRVRLADTASRDIGKQHVLTEYWREIAAGKDIVMKVSESATTKQVIIHFVAVVRDSTGRPFRVVATRMPVDSIYEIVERTFRGRAGSEISVVELLDGEGLILYSNINKQDILKNKSGDWDYLQNILSGRDSGSVRHQYEGREEITAFAREQGYQGFPGSGWMLVVCTPVDVAFASAYSQGRQFGTLFATIGLAVLAVTFLASRATVRPLKQLSAAAGEIGRGNLDVAADVTSDDEIGQLGKAFNNMVRDLKDSENKFRDMAELLPQVVYEIDTQGTVVFANRHALELFGYLPEELAGGVNAQMLISPEDHARLSANTEKVLRGDRIDNAEYTAVRKDGSTFPFLTFAVPVRAGGDIVGSRGLGIDLTERKRMEGALREREAFLSSILDSIQEVITIVDADLRILRTNTTAERVFASVMPLVGSTCYEKYMSRNEPCPGCPALKTLRTGEPGRRLFPMTVPGDTKETWVELLTYPLVDESGARVVRMIEYAGNVTERVKAEQEAQRSNQFRERVMESATNAIYALDLEGRFRLANRRAFEMTGYAADALIGAPFAMLLSPAAFPAVRKQFEYVIRQGRPVSQVETELLRKDGSTATITFSLAPLFEEGRITGVAGTAEDITERKQAERLIRESEEKLRTITHTAQDAIVMMDEAGNISFWNPAAERMFGYRSAEALGSEMHELIGPQRYYASYKRGFARFRTTGEGSAVGKTLELGGMRKDGTEFPIELSLSAIQISEAWHAIGVIRDITGRKRSEEETQRRSALVDRLNSTLVELAQNEALYQGELEPAFRTITEASATALKIARVSVWFYIDGDSGIACRDLYETKSGAHSQGVVLRAADFPAYFRALREEYCIAAGDAVSDPRTVEFAESYLKPLGIASMLDVPIRVAGRVVGVACHEHMGTPRAWAIEEQSFVTAIAGFISMAIESSERKQAEKKINKLNEELEAKVEERTRQLLDAQEELIRKEKLSTLGQIAGSVGHELRNPLGVMNNAVYYLQTVLDGAGETVKEYLDIIKSEITGAERIVSDLLDAVRTKPPHVQTVAAGDLVRMSLEKCAVPENVTVRLDLGPSLTVAADPLQMKQVFINLISNAVDAMPGGGELRIRVSATMDEGRRTKEQGSSIAQACVASSRPSSVVISVADTGCGMSPETLKKLFQPLFSTKARGIGLGLVVVKNLTEANGGSVNVTSEPGTGTVFTIALPAGGDRA